VWFLATAANGSSKGMALGSYHPGFLIRWAVAVALAVAGTLAWAAPAARRKPVGLNLKEILARMDEAAKHLRTVSTSLEYTKVTVLVDDRSTEYGELFYHKSKNPEVLLKFEKPDPKVILFKKNKAEIFLPKTNQIQEYDLERHSGLVQKFLLLGFGTDTNDLNKAYEVKLVGEEQLSGDMAAVLELTPRNEQVAAQLAKVQLWISEESWLPLQQKFFEPGGDYLLTRYSSVRVNRTIPSSTFHIQAPKNAKRIKMQ
jgi:outer membrane lipoprotein-sorting protein